MGGPAIVVCDRTGRVVFETKDFDQAKRECFRLNAGGSEMAPFVPVETLNERLPDGSVWRTPIKRQPPNRIY